MSVIFGVFINIHQWGIMSKSLFFIVLTALFFVGCEQKEPVQTESPLKSVDNRYMKDLAIGYLKKVWIPVAPANTLYDKYEFFRKHRPEIIHTLEVADSLTVADKGVVLFRYSLGGDIYRSTIWMRKMNDRWFVSLRLSEYSEEYEQYDDETKEKAKKVIEKATVWKEEGKEPWWGL